jgi:hypothetical protein
MLKIKENVDLKELEKHKFEKYYDLRENSPKGKKEHNLQTYKEWGYRYNDGTNIIEIVEKRENSHWIHFNKERQIYVYESDWDMGVSMNVMEVVFDLITAGLVEKVSD